MTGRGRPRIGQRVELVIPDNQVDELDRLAVIAGISRADLIRRILDGWLTVKSVPANSWGQHRRPTRPPSGS